ncbi:hypothetical protein ACN2XU_21275 [Primorskyibacter sp. 2E107]|uniref:hypothetical protein n=1 Tax=Primorskyibacter sp. 2E107 TaxID=3403458 RepID=UPI003AF73C49
MTISLSIHPDRRLAFFRFHGNVDTRQGVEVFERYIASPEFSSEFKMLTDTSDLETVETGYRSMLSSILGLRRSLRTFQTPVRSVIYARSDVFFGLARILEQIQNPMSKISIVVTRDEAEALRLAGQPERSMTAFKKAVSQCQSEKSERRGGTRRL